MKKILLVVSFVMACAALNAQDVVFKRYINNFDFALGGGMHSVQFDPEGGGDHHMRAGGTFNMQYRYAGWDRFSVGIGLGFTNYSAKSSYDWMQDTVAFVDPENGESYTFKTTFHNWNEVQRTINMEVPIAGYYRYPLNELWGMVFGLGVKLDVPFSKHYVTKNEQSDGEMVRSGEFPSTNVEYSELPQHGFYDTEEYDGRAKMKGAGVSMFGEIGASRPLKNNRSLYLGAYFSHSLMNSLKSCDNHLYNPETKEYSGVVSSNLVDKTHLMAFGVKVGMSWGWPEEILPSIDTLAERLLAEQREAERLAAEQAEAEILAAERLAAEQAEAERLAAEQKAEEERIAAEKAEAERLAAEQAEAERLAALKAEEERLAAEKAAEEEATKKAEEAVEWINKHIVVNFELGKAIINSTPEIEANIQFLIGFLQKYPDRILLIKGHTCDLGNPASNIKLSKSRAEAMKKILVDKGCDPSHIETKGMGSSEPLVPNTCEENRKKNRRIEIKIEHILKE